MCEREGPPFPSSPPAQPPPPPSIGVDVVSSQPRRCTPTSWLLLLLSQICTQTGRQADRRPGRTSDAQTEHRRLAHILHTRAYLGCGVAEERMIGPRSEGNAGRPLRARSMRLCRERTKPASLVARQCCMSALCLLACAVPRDACSRPARLCYTARRPRMQLARPVGAETCSAGRSTSTRACGGSATAIRRPVLAGGPPTDLVRHVAG